MTYFVFEQNILKKGTNDRILNGFNFFLNALEKKKHVFLPCWITLSSLHPISS